MITLLKILNLYLKINLMKIVRIKVNLIILLRKINQNKEADQKKIIKQMARFPTMQIIKKITKQKTKNKIIMMKIIVLI
jgi:hypothetical protein